LHIILMTFHVYVIKPKLRKKGEGVLKVLCVSIVREKKGLILSIDVFE